MLRNRRVLFLVVALHSVVLFSCSSSTDSSETAEKTDEVAGVDTDQSFSLISDETPIPLKEDIASGTLENGITYFALSNESPGNNFEARLVIKAGGLAQEPADSGVAHFLEHMVFYGSENFPDGIFEVLESYGIDSATHLNAWTSCDATTYTFTANSSENLGMVLKALDDIATSATFPENLIERERNVILEEARPDESIDGLEDAVSEGMYREGTPYEACNILGTDEGIRAVTSQDLKEYYDLWYRPDLMSVILVGDLPTEILETKIIEQFSDNPEKAGPEPITTLISDPFSETKIRTFSHPETTNIVSVDYSAPFAKQGTLGSEYESFILNLAFDMTHEQIVTRVESGEISFSEPWGSTFLWDRHLRFFGWGFDSENPQEELKELLKEIRFLKEEGFSEALLQAELAEMTTVINDGLNQSIGRQDYEYAQDLVNHVLTETPVPDAEYMAELKLSWIADVTLEEVNAYFMWLMDATAPQIMIFNDKESETPTVEEIQQAILDSETESIDGIENAEVVPLLENLMVAPQKSTETVNRISHTDFWSTEVHEFNFSNGTTVVYTYSDIEPDEVSVNACAPGGYDELQTGDSAVVDFVTGVIDQSGVGNLSPQLVDRFVETNRISLQSSIYSTFKCQTGKTSSESLVGLMELMNLRLLAPRVDEQAFDQGLIDLDRYLENADDPYWASYAKMLELTYVDVSHSIFPTSEQVEALTPQKVLEMYEEVFTLSEDLAVVIVGDISLEDVEELARTYVATLPTDESHESWVPQPNMPDNFVFENVTAGVNQAYSGFDLQFHMKPNWGEFEEFDKMTGVLSTEVSAMIIKQILEDRLFEKLREELGISYGAASVDFWYEIKPELRFFTSISVDTDMETLELAYETVVEEIGRLAFDPLEESEFSLAQEIIWNELSYVSNHNVLWDLTNWKIFTELEWPMISPDGRNYFSQYIDAETLMDPQWITSVTSVLFGNEANSSVTVVFRDQPLT
ncbi:insulinase family protein [Acidimicrobiaceae bacterium]|nr:insulinase family protein [Acidimicrobiaceae bacterium]